MAVKINIESLGCRLNQSEIQSVITVLKNRGHVITQREDADIFIVNSCKVTLHSERKTRKLIYRAERASKKNARIIVTGCCADKPERQGNILFIPNDYKHLIPDIIDEIIDVTDLIKFPPSRFSLPAPTAGTTTRINLKIQDGCDNFCSYCIIPFTRGSAQSKAMDVVLNEFNDLLDAGYREIVLTGVMIGNYRHENADLADLVSSLLEIPGEFRLHLASISPAYVTERLIDVLDHDRMVRHLNLSLQSGSDKILERMNRGYTSSDYYRLVDKIKKKDRDFNLTTDVIVGFPGEGDDDFAETMSLIRHAAFSHIHTFRFSPRPGTAAFESDDNVSEETKKERSIKVIELYLKQKENYYMKFDGRESILLSERSYNSRTRGFNEYYVPVEMDRALDRNKFIRIKTHAEPGASRLRGSPL
ncbi:MAG TPA: tRNA (N(6)-L-threonylcarbamoyladenosine(37)-C(2))-methylthiotransferase MtaB [Spirochaetota bacterium]|nr:tRNA (N(6)-L-threonylcarbamoyladenosine(37)-C(2))-methylthiotransferase MtaB [Spirochaetota bacterium]HPI88520.1 tRNA (N(6)-L-threonylcarbamoyladenosine(37)-C(2))-methylthiotransferase MtaB [Spirochaetota bacterium]HPR48000.1 tRNA (N(6)-L-threonylcarbamoyladenosine(37)-C(2))-methylthiotransferase MtaB [Spirochaetota bacterium]